MSDKEAGSVCGLKIHNCVSEHYPFPSNKEIARKRRLKLLKKTPSVGPKLKNECNFLRAVHIFIICLLPLLCDARRRNCIVCLERLHESRTEDYIITIVRANRQTTNGQICGNPALNHPVCFLVRWLKNGRAHGLDTLIDVIRFYFYLFSSIKQTVCLLEWMKSHRVATVSPLTAPLKGSGPVSLRFGPTAPTCHIRRHINRDGG